MSPRLLFAPPIARRRCFLGCEQSHTPLSFSFFTFRQSLFGESLFSKSFSNLLALLRRTWFSTFSTSFVPSFPCFFRMGLGCPADGSDRAFLGEPRAVSGCSIRQAILFLQLFPRSSLFSTAFPCQDITGLFRYIWVFVLLLNDTMK